MTQTYLLRVSQFLTIIYWWIRMVTADFSNATSHAMIPNGSGATVSLNLTNNDRVAIAFDGGDNSQIWYSYVSGNWNDPNTWTLDGAISPLYKNPSSEIPSIADSVVIQSGRTVTMDINGANATRLEIIGSLDLVGTTGHTFGTLLGSGTLRLSGASGIENYPSTNDDALFTDTDEGGTLEYYGSGFTLNDTRNANNLLVNLSLVTDVFTAMGNLTVNGNLTITNGIFQFNDNSSTSSINVNINGNLLVETNGVIDVGTGNARHELNLFGDFTNQGDVDFTNRSSQITGSEATDGIVDVNFLSSTQDQIVDLQGQTDFYRIEINKGVDDTYIVDISATNAANFNLFGSANESTNGSQATTNDNALGLIYGTVKVGSNITISPLTTGGVYSIFEGAQLWVDGGTIEKNSGAAIVPYGELRISSGLINAPISSGVTIRDNGLLTIEGGTVNANQFRTSVEGASALGGLVMSGGIFNILGGSTFNDYYTFSLTYEGNVFNMSGGVINVSDVNSFGGIYINSSDENINVTGGTINLDVTNGNNLTVTSRAPFFNLNVLESTSSAASVLVSNGSSGTGAGETTINLTEFKILNDLHIDNTSGNGTAFNAGGIDIGITGSLLIDNGSSVDFSAMNLTFEGTGSSSIDIGLASTLILDSLEINKTNEVVSVNLTNGQPTAIQVDDLLNVAIGNFNINTFDIVANGNINLSDTVGTETSTGHVVMSGLVAQSISSTSGAFYDLEINNANGVSLSGDIGVNRLDLNSGVFDIGTSKLTLLSEVQTTGSFGTSLMLQTGGNASDGGLEYYFDGTSNPAEILFPFGSNSKYTPARIDLVNVTDDGYIQINPVDSELLTTDLSGGNILGYYWRVRNSNFSSLPDVSTLSFTADATDDPTSGPLTSFVPGGVEDGVDSDDTPTTDTNFNRFFENNGITGLSIEFDGEFSTGNNQPFQLRTANYTAGVSTRFPDSSPDIYYTTLSADRQDWDNEICWTLVDGTDGADDGNTGFPGIGDIAVLRSYGNNNDNHWVTLRTNLEVAQVIFENDLGGWKNRLIVRDPSVTLDLGPISGVGTFQLWGDGVDNFAEFIGSSDLGDFSSEVNSQFNFRPDANATMVMPNNITEYPQVRIEAGNQTNGDDVRIVETSVPIIINSWLQLDRASRFRINHDVTVLDDVRVTWQLERTTIEIGDAREVTFDIGGDLLMRDGAGDDAARILVKNDNLNGYEHTVRVRGNIDFEAGLAATSTFDLYNGVSPNNNAILELSGEGDFSFTNNAPGVVTPDLYRVVMNAGTDTTNTFTFNNTFNLNGINTAAPQALELQNGKLTFNSASFNLQLADNSDFSIPSTAGLEVTQGTVTSTGSNIILDGLLRINGGTANFGTSDIEYSTSGTALINVSSGTLNVGGQIRRSTSSTIGILKYRQTGGDVDIATDGATTTSRGVFEVLNGGSEFTLTGGTFNIQSGVSGDANLSLELNPTTVNLTGSTITIFENLGSNYGANFFNVSSSIALNNLTVANSIDLPDVRLFNQNLEVNDLTINTNQVVLSNGVQPHIKW